MNQTTTRNAEPTTPWTQARDAAIKPRLVSTNLRRANGTWLRLCPTWFCTGCPARWTSTEHAG